MIKHANVVTFVDWATGYFETKATDRISGHPPLHFDLSTFDIYGTFLAGAELHLVPAAANLMPNKLAALIRDSELTQWFAVPSIFTYMAKFDAFEHGDFPSLERVIWCGEVLPTPILMHWMERLPHATFTNLYGRPRRRSRAATTRCRRSRRARRSPCRSASPARARSCSSSTRSCSTSPPGEIGDLFIAGVGLSPGYWRDEEKTAAAFVPTHAIAGERIYRTGDLAKVREDGLVDFLGRADSQIKSRGYRIELGEIETALNALDDIRECAVVGVETGGFEGTAICCAYAPAKGDSADPTEIREQSRKRSPPTCSPRWLSAGRAPEERQRQDRPALDQGALRGRGDRRAFPTAPRPGARLDRSNGRRSRRQRARAAVFLETLNVQVPSPEADLIESGLIDSLALVELLFAIEREFAVSLPLEDLEIENFRSVNRISEVIVGAQGMSAIRPLERDDLPQVVSLYEHVARSGSRTPPPGLAAYFERTFLDHPWADPEIPSLVYADGDKIVGFLGSSVRRLSSTAGRCAWASAASW